MSVSDQLHAAHMLRPKVFLSARRSLSILSHPRASDIAFFLDYARPVAGEYSWKPPSQRVTPAMPSPNYNYLTASSLAL